MKNILAFAGGFLLLAFLTGCSSPPKLTQPTGDWVNANTHQSQGVNK